MEETLVALRKKCVIGFVGGSDLEKQVEQLGKDGKSMFSILPSGPTESN